MKGKEINLGHGASLIQEKLTRWRVYFMQVLPQLCWLFWRWQPA
jgi:hypothetical protein